MNSNEHTTLLQGSNQRKKSHPSLPQVLNTNKKKIVTMTCFIVILIMTFFIQMSDGSPFFHHNNTLHSNRKRNVIFFVTDGMGPASLSLTRSFRQFTEGLPINDTLNLDKHLIGNSRTRSSDSLVTDSAAGATAFSCALKTYNSAIGVNPYKQPCGTILEAAKLDGYLTGLVVTTRITDATPAAFSAHTDFRVQEDLIALHQIGEYPLGPVIDLMIGGGRTHFYPRSDSKHVYGTHGTRQDGRNLIDEVKSNGWQYVGNRDEFDQLKMGQNVSLPLLALMADFDIPFEIDRNSSIYPSLEEQTVTALNALNEASKDCDQGFFLMVEGSRIDHAGHQNDPAAQVREVLAFDRAFKAAMDFADNTDVETILISTSDHETGGLTVARQVTKEYPEYIWLPQVLANSSHSGEYTKNKIIEFSRNLKDDDVEDNIKEIIKFIKKEILERDLGILDYSQEDVEFLARAKTADVIQDKINDMISFRAQIGWTTHGHSAVDVNIYAYTNKKNTWYDILDHLQGNHENIEIGQYMSNYLNLDLGKVTAMINETKHSPELSVKDLEKGLIYDDYHHKLINNN
ncbi:repressible alkaline phosphatase [Monosporozyma unispora]|nr:vacuolar alkaline phosphatase [Kazachstania unispora]